MEENKEKVIAEEVTNASESPKKKNTGKIIALVLGLILVCGLGYYGYTEYQAQQEARRIDVAFNNEETEVAYGTDLMSLITVNKADEVTVNLVDADWNEVTEPKANIEYKAVYTCMAADNVQTLEKTIVFIDSTAPVINGVKETQEIAFGSEFNALNGITATDDVDGDVEVVLNGDEVNTKAPKEYSLVYTAKDLSDNTATVKSTVKVLEPTCGANASWNGSDCVCNKGYQGDAWSSCTAIPVKKPTNNKPTNSSQGTASSGKSQAQLDCEASWGTWKDNSWCDWGSSNNSGSSNSSAGNSSGGNSGSTGIRPGTYPTLDACKIAASGCTTGYICFGDDAFGWEYACH